MMKTAKGLEKIRVAFFVGLFLMYVFLPSRSVAVQPTFPLRANYFLNWRLDENTAKELSKWDLVILDMETQVNSLGLLRKMREWNPKIKLLAYITPQEIAENAATTNSALRNKLAAGIYGEWYLTNSRGVRLSYWSGHHILNVTPDAPKRAGQNLADYISQFAATEIIGSGLWDGIFYDNAWSDITYFVGVDVDTDKDGVANTDADAKWRAGMISLYHETRQKIGPNYIIVGNGNTRLYRDELDGNMIENFVPTAWAPTMRTYVYNNNGAKPAYNIINANTSNKGGRENYKAMRFGLASALMEDGYYSFDFGDTNHGQTWWYDEYSVGLGLPRGKSASLTGQANYDTGVWKRDFEYGIAIVNSTGSQSRVDLGGDYEKIHGMQDKTVNNGEIVSELSLDSYDGQILLKTLSTIYDVLYPNGSFIRFFYPDGRRARNGFFVYDARAKGSDKVAAIDLNNDGRRDTVVLSGNKLSAERDDGQSLFKVYPYTANYFGTLNGSLGDVNGDGKTDVIVAPADNTARPVKIYDYDGQNVSADWSPLGVKLKNGIKVYLATKNSERFFVVGGALAQEPFVYVYDSNKKLIRKWLAFEAAFRGGISLAVGDINNDGADEVIVGAGPGKKPVVKIFNLEGKKIYPEFTAYAAAGNPGAEVIAVDVDFDKIKEIGVVSKNVGM